MALTPEQEAIVKKFNSALEFIWMKENVSERETAVAVLRSFFENKDFENKEDKRFESGRYQSS